MGNLKIGGLKLKNPLFLAPMVDVTDLCYRLLCRRAGAAMAYTEMLYIDAILHENKKTKMLMKTCREDRPLGIQVTGNNEGEFKRAIPYLKKYDLVDINCGCPSLRITGSEAGSYLLENPDKIRDIIKILKSAGLIVTAKIRLGFKKNNVLKVAKIIEKAGADAITLHARLAIDGNDIPADWRWIKKIKQNVKIPVIGNGDVFSGKDAERMMRETRCDGVMIGRGAIGNPLIFEKVLRHLDSYPPTRPEINKPNFEINKYTNHPKSSRDDNFDVTRNLEMFKEYLWLEKKYFGEEVDLGKVKYVGGKFLRGVKGAAKLRSEIMKLKSLEEIEDFVSELGKK